MNREPHPLSPEDLMAFIDGQLSPPLAVRAAAHVETCTACASEVADAKRLSSEMAQWEVEDAPVRMTTRVNAELQRLAKPRRRFSLPAWMGQKRTWVFAAAGTVAVLTTLVAVDLVKFAGENNARIMAKASGLSAKEPLAERDSPLGAAEGAGRGGRGQGQGQGADQFRLKYATEGSFEAGLQNNQNNLNRNPANRAQGQEFPVEGGERGGAIGEQGKGEQGQNAASTPQSRRPETPGESFAPMIIRSIHLTLITKDFDGARARIDTIVRDTMGYVDSLTDHGSKGEGRALSATLRLPADRLDAGLKELRKIGMPQDEAQKSDDVTNQFVDLTARMNNARNTEQRLLALLRERTGVLKDVLEVEQEISRVREQIERMQAQLKNISQRVAYSSVQLDITEEYHAKIEDNVLPSGMTRLHNAGVGGYELARETVLGILIFALQFGPVLLMLAVVLTGIAFLAWRRISRSMKAAT